MQKMLLLLLAVATVVIAGCQTDQNSGLTQPDQTSAPAAPVGAGTKNAQ